MALTESKREQIEAVAMDMWLAYQCGEREATASGHCLRPSAKYLNEAVPQALKLEVSD